MFPDDEIILRVVASVRAYGEQDLLDNRETILSNCFLNSCPHAIPMHEINVQRSIDFPCDSHAFLWVRLSHAVLAFSGKVELEVLSKVRYKTKGKR